MSEFIGYTTGLECFVPGITGIHMIKIEYSKAADGVKLQAVSGLNLEPLARKFSATISRDAYAGRPVDPYENTEEAIWALRQVGLKPAALEA